MEDGQVLVQSPLFGLRLSFCLVFSITLSLLLLQTAEGEGLPESPTENGEYIAAEECNTLTVGTDTATWDFPMHTNFHDSRTQVIYLADEIGMAGSITDLALDVVTVPGMEMNDWTIRMKHTPLDSYTTASFETTGWTVVYEANEIVDSTGWRTFNFSRPFKYNGIENLMVDFSHDNNDYSSNGQCRASAPGGIRSVLAYDDSHYFDPLDWSDTFYPATSFQSSSNVPNIKLMICSVIGVDFNSDGIPNLSDFGYFSSTWGESCSEPNWCGGSDLNKDGIVDTNDLRILSLFWLWPAADWDMDRVVRMPDLAGLTEFWKSEDCADIQWCYGCDFDKSGQVDIYDMEKLAEYWLMHDEWR